MKPGNPKLKMNKPQILEAQKKTRWNILRGDMVEIICSRHPEFRKQGIVTNIDRKKDRVTMEGVNMAPCRYRGNQNVGTQGLTILRERSVHSSNVNLVDLKTGRPTRISWRVLSDGTKERVSKLSGSVIPRPNMSSRRKRVVTKSSPNESDTLSDDDVWEITHIEQN